MRLPHFFRRRVGELITQNSYLSWEGETGVTIYLVALLLLPVTFTGLPAWAYEESPVTDAGTVKGTVKLDGKVPKPKGYNLTTLPDPFYCGRAFLMDRAGAFCSLSTLGRRVSFATL